jgi:hypothetical protein
VFVTYPTADPDTWASVVKVANVPEERLLEKLGKMADVRIQDVRKV